MIDIHHHLLFGLDDGPSDIEISVAMADMSVKSGVTHIVCTPHSERTIQIRPRVESRTAGEGARAAGRPDHSRPGL